MDQKISIGTYCNYFSWTKHYRIINTRVRKQYIQMWSFLSIIILINADHTTIICCDTLSNESRHASTRNNGTKTTTNVSLRHLLHIKTSSICVFWHLITFCHVLHTSCYQCKQSTRAYNNLLQHSETCSFMVTYVT